MFLQTQPHFVFSLVFGEKKTKCEGINGSDSCFLLSCSVLLKLNPANMAVSVPSQSLGQFVLLGKRRLKLDLTLPFGHCELLLLSIFI